MKLILTQEVSGLGTPGDIVDVKDGYARNFLLPRGLATGWSKGGEKQVVSIRAARAARQIASLDEAKSAKASLESKAVKVAARAGAGGRLFGAVTPADVVAALATVGAPSVDRRKVEIAQPIKTIGTYAVTVRLHPEVQAKINIQVIAAS